MGIVRTVHAKEQKLVYTLTWKPVKNINIRINAQGEIRVSAPPSLSVCAVDDVIQKQAPSLLEALRKLQQKQKQKKAKPNNASIVRLLGEKVPLQIHKGTTQSIERRNHALEMVCLDPLDQSEIDHLIEQFRLSLCKDVFTKIIHHYAPFFEQQGVPLPRFRLKQMTSRWGSCSLNTHTISLNIKLIETPMSCIEYVILHEFCHFIHPNHSKDFYALIQTHMPDYRKPLSILRKWYL